MNPEQTVFLIGMDLVDIDICRQSNVALKQSVIDFHRDRLQCASIAIVRLWNISYSPDGQVSILNRQFDLRSLHARQFHADLYTVITAICVDRRLPGRRCELWKSRPNNLRCHIVKSSLRPPESHCANRFHRITKIERICLVFNYAGEKTLARVVVEPFTGNVG